MRAHGRPAGLMGAAILALGASGLAAQAPPAPPGKPANVIEVTAEADERLRFKEAIRARLLKGDFAGIDKEAAKVRASRETFANGTWKLNVLYQSFQDREDKWSDADWTQAIKQAEAWRKARPKSVAAHIALGELWIGFSWKARGSDTADKVKPESWPVFRERLGRAAEPLHAAETLSEDCPRLYASLLGLAIAQSWSREQEAKVFAKGSQRYPDFQPIYDGHLGYLDPKWHGDPGDWRRAAEAIAAQPGGKERYARSAWAVGLLHKPVRDEMSWAILKPAFLEMIARYPDSLEVASAYCRFTVCFRDRAETRRLFKQIGDRMVPGVWSTQKYFTECREWANLGQIQEQVGGGDRRQ